VPSPQPSLGRHALERVVEEECFRPGLGSQVGAELEWLVRGPDGRRLGPEGLPPALAGAGRLPSGSTLSFEPGGQLELSSPPCPDESAACAVLGADTASVAAALAPAGAELVGVGLCPEPADALVVASPRYLAMDAYFRGDGGAGHTMMRDTASVQVSLDNLGGPALGRRWRLAHDLGPTLAACFANSPTACGAPGRASSWRLVNWWRLDPSRSAPALGPSGPQRDWLRYSLAARVMLIRRPDGRFCPVGPPMSFGRWMAAGHELGWPTLDDYRYHLTTLFPPVRPLGRLELRYMDALPEPWWRVAVAVAAALLDDPEAGEVAARATRASAGLWREAGAEGLSHPGLAASARQCFLAALDALERRGADPGLVEVVSRFQDRYVGPGRSPAHDRLEEGAAHR
jgi:glutamate--cysteine ligase